MTWLRDDIKNDHKIAQIKEFIQIAKELDIKPSQLAIAWCLKNPNVSTVILGASSNEQLKENLQSIEVKSKIDLSLLNRLNSIFHL